MHSLMFLHTSQETQQSVSFKCSGKCKRCRRVKTTTFTSAPAGIALTASPLQQTTPEIEYSFDNGCKKAIITCPHTPGSTTNFYLLARTDSPLSPENQLPSDAAVIVPFFYFQSWMNKRSLKYFLLQKESQDHHLLL